MEGPVSWPQPASRHNPAEAAANKIRKALLATGALEGMETDDFIKRVQLTFGSLFKESTPLGLGSLSKTTKILLQNHRVIKMPA
jgi:hypothetical protein